MITFLRNLANSFIAKILISVLALSFIFWGGSSAFYGNQASSVAEVDEEPISGLNFLRAYEMASRNAASNLPDQSETLLELSKQFSVQRALQDLIREQVMTNHANKHSVGLSDDELAEIILNDPTFKNDLGFVFDRNKFQLILRSIGYSEKDYIDYMRDLERRRQVYDALASTPAVPSIMTNLQNLYFGEERQIGYVTIQGQDLEEIADPADDKLQAFFDQHKEKYRAPEYRKLELFILDPEGHMDLDSINEEMIASELARRKAAEEKPELRAIQQIIIANDEMREKVETALGENKSFEEIAQLLDIQVELTDMGARDQASFQDQDLAKQIFELETDQARLLKGENDEGLYNVTSITPAVAFEETDSLKEDIKKDLALKAAGKKLEDIIDEIDNEISEGQAIQDLASNYDLKVMEVTLARDGRGIGDVEAPSEQVIPDQDKILNAAFLAQKDEENDPLETEGRKMVWFTVKDIIESRVVDLEHVRDNVVKNWKKAEALKNLLAKTNIFIQGVQKTRSLQAQAEQEKLSYEVSDNFTRLKGLDQLGENIRSKAFNGPKNFISFAKGNDENARIVFQVISVEEKQALAGDTLKTQLANLIQGDLYAQFASAMHEKAVITVNQERVNAIVNR